MQSFASNKGFKSGGVKCPPVIMGLKEVIKHQIVAVYMHCKTCVRSCFDTTFVRDSETMLLVLVHAKLCFLFQSVSLLLEAK